MPMKRWFLKFQPPHLFIVLLLTVLFFITELIFSHVTHALTLLMNSYQMLCNIFALTGCIITLKSGKKVEEKLEKPPPNPEDNTVPNTEAPPAEPSKTCQDKPASDKITTKSTHQETKLKNTFGWARIDVISLLICCVFLASLSFSVVVESLQTLVHIDHFDEIHHTISVLCIGAAGLLLNGVCYLLIGGYTFHQGSFLYVTESGDVILNRIVIPDLVSQGGRRLSRTRTIPLPSTKQRQGFKEMCRDVLGCIIVIVCALLVRYTEKDIAKFIDPVLALISAASLMLLSYPYMKESCLILLQTMPGSLNIDTLKQDILKQFPGIVNIHDFHVWQFTATKIISTVHIIFENQKNYLKLMEDIKEFLIEYGITQVTIQPEFFTKTKSIENLSTSCVLPCQGQDCLENHCCPTYEEPLKKICTASKKGIFASGSSLPDLRSIKVIDKELSKTTEAISTLEQNDDGK